MAYAMATQGLVVHLGVLVLDVDALLAVELADLEAHVAVCEFGLADHRVALRLLVVAVY